MAALIKKAIRGLNSKIFIQLLLFIFIFITANAPLHAENKLKHEDKTRVHGKIKSEVIRSNGINKNLFVNPYNQRFALILCFHGEEHGGVRALIVDYKYGDGRDMYYQDGPWSEDVVSAVWFEDNLYISTCGAYGDGGVFSVNPAGRKFERIFPEKAGNARLSDYITSEIMKIDGAKRQITIKYTKDDDESSTVVMDLR